MCLFVASLSPGKGQVDFVHKVSIEVDRLEIVYKRRISGSAALEVIKFQFKGDKGFINDRSLTRFFVIALIQVWLLIAIIACQKEWTN